MKKFTFSYQGMALGGVVVVQAKASAQARALAFDLVKAQFDAARAATLVLEKTEALPGGPAVLYHGDGDY